MARPKKCAGVRRAAAPARVGVGRPRAGGRARGRGRRSPRGSAPRPGRGRTGGPGTRPGRWSSGRASASSSSMRSSTRAAGRSRSAIVPAPSRHRSARPVDEIGVGTRVFAVNHADARSHALLVLLVDEPVDRALEPTPWRLLQVVALVEREPRAVRAQRVETDVPDLVVAGRASRSSCTCSPRSGSTSLTSSSAEPLPTERHPVDHPAQPAVVVGVAGPQHVDALDHRRVVGPPVVVLEQRPDPRRPSAASRTSIDVHASVCSTISAGCRALRSAPCLS